MKKFMALAFLITATVLMASCATCRGGWTKADTAWELADIGLMTADWSQTQHIASNPGRYYENNPILGLHPSISKLNLYFAIWVPAHAAVSCWVLDPKWRRVWQVGTAGVEVWAIKGNLDIGLPIIKP